MLFSHSPPVVNSLLDSCANNCSSAASASQGRLTADGRRLGIFPTLSFITVTASDCCASITAEGVEWQWKSFDRAAAFARAVPELERMARFAQRV